MAAIKKHVLTRRQQKYIRIKRILDLGMASAATVILSPVLLGISIAIRLDSPGPVFFRQKRVGIHKTYFTIYKFRTMRTDTPKDMPTHLLKDPDAFLTRTGRFLRKTSLDELSQLFNILKGDMSFVGPRPALWNQEDLVAERERYGANDVLPGLTGWAQINGYRGDTSIKRRIEYDIFYIENWTMSFDIKIMFLTIFKGFINKNAY